ncbi:AhpC/TSA family protein [Virgibacillus senegalensis]|uniref:AhpC/TSA family protein n=1 Tax=Virgibacillus senegalensis TaxID=1499679 RepID=UPI00069F0853|nr:AhpC/TSA family protein [Virgibacillus senegalensis]
MREHTEEIEQESIKIAVVLPTGTQFLKQVYDVYGPFPFAILGDPDRISYKQLKLPQMNKGKSLKVVSNYLFSGRLREVFPKDTKERKVIKQAMLKQDVFQLGGSWLFDQTGKVHWFHIDTEPADHATIPDILIAVEALSKKQ